MISKRKVLLSVLVALVSWCAIELARLEYSVTPLEEFVKSHGYPIEVHKVQTEDGFILTMHRIPHGSREDRGQKPPIMLQHGSAGSSYNFVSQGPESSLGFLLADLGYDVWMGNCRGNNYSSKHISYSTSDSKFWDNSWDEMGIYDLPIEIDYILNHTRAKKLPYIGFSMGTTMMGVLLSSKPEYNDIIEIFIGLAPAFRLPVVNGFLIKLFGLYTGPWVVKYFGYCSWFPWVDGLSEILRNMCHPKGMFSFICVLIYNDFGASTQLKLEDMPSIFSTMLSTGTIKTSIHFGQMHLHDKFRPFVHGASEDKAKYGVEEPPEYNLEKVTAPTAFIYSDSDSAVSEEGVKELSQLLPNVTLYKVQHSAFNHLDFLFGKDVVQLVYKEVFRILTETKNVK